MHRRRIPLVVAVFVLTAACSDSGATESTTATDAVASTTTTTPKTTTTTATTTTARVIEVPTLNLTFDGDSCTYEGPTELAPGFVRLMFYNDSAVTAAVNFAQLLGDKTIQDAFEHGQPWPTKTHGPSWARELGTWQSVLSGASQEWVGDLDPGSYFMVCARVSPLSVWFGTGLTVAGGEAPDLPGDGGNNDGQAGRGEIITVAGTGEFGYSGDGGPAIEAQLEAPSSLVFDSAGNLYIGDSSTVRKVDTNGLITTVVGTGVPGFSGEGLRATEAEIHRPHIGIDAAGDLWVLNLHQPALRRVGSDGIITTIAGTGIEGTLPEEGSRAADTDLCGLPHGPAFDPEGNAYVSCEFEHVVLRIDSEGTVTIAAGTGEAGFSGDGGRATQAQLFIPLGIAFDREGNLFIADTANARIRMIDTDGIITTIAGTGTPGYSGDGGPATEAEVTPFSVAVDSVGNVFFSSSSGRVVRMIDTDGIITTVAGGGASGFLGDGGPATEAGFKGGNLGIAVDTHGNLYIADDGDNRVRKVILQAVDNP